MLTTLAVLSMLSALTNREAPAGTALHIRLTTAVGSYASKAGTPIRANLIAPVIVKGATVLPAGSVLTGTLTSVVRVGLGIRHETSSLHLNFDGLSLQDGPSVPLLARVSEVDNGKERVTEDGNIRGARSTSSMCYRTSGYVRTLLLWNIHADVAEWAIRTLLVQVPDPEIYYPAGVELTLILKAPLRINTDRKSAAAIPGFTEDDHRDLAGLVATMPYRAYAPVSHRPADVVNAIFFGSREQLTDAFVAAGWEQAAPKSLRAQVRGLRAVAETQNFRAAPMSGLLMNETLAGMSWQKGLNDFSKRHHVRLWKQTGTWQGQEIWIGTATRDVDFAFMRPGQTLTHRVERNVDRERDKIMDDLAFTTCVETAERLDRPTAPRWTRTATGDTISTDGRVAVMQFNACRTPRLSTETVDQVPLPMRGRGLYRFIRREILSVRSDLLRDNIYWRSFEASRWLYLALRRHQQQVLEARSEAHPQKAVGPHIARIYPNE